MTSLATKDRVQRIFSLVSKQPPIIAACLIVTLAIIFSHGPVIRQNFSQHHWEDELFFEHSQAHIDSIADCFTAPPLWPGLYRPLTTNCYYYAVDKLLDNRIELYHTINVLLLGLNSLLLFSISSHLLSGYWALIPAGLFASRYAHVEVVTNTVEFQSLLSVFFSLLSLKLFILGRVQNRIGFEIFASLFFALALFSKETAIILPFIILLYGWLFDSLGAWRHYLAPFIIAIVWTILFVLIFRAISDYEPTGFSYTGSAPTILLNYTAHMADFSNWLTSPMDSVLMPEKVLRLARAGGSQIFFLLLVAATAIVVGLHRRLQFRLAADLRVFTFGFGFFLIATAPFVLFEDRLLMRYSYFGHAGLAICAGVLWKEIARGVAYLLERLWKFSRPALNLSRFFSG